LSKGLSITRSTIAPFKFISNNELGLTVVVEVEDKEAIPTNKKVKKSNVHNNKIPTIVARTDLKKLFIVK